MKNPPIYVETSIRCSMEELWAHTQQPELHQQWDLRFTTIEYLPRAADTEPQQFLYATRIGFGLGVEGRGESVGSKEKNGERTSVLKFWSDERLSLIAAGSGYWKYIPMPAPGGLRFFTGYDYKTRFGLPGRLFDRAVFRPLIGWATAWSFDCLRLWLERGIRPAVLVRLALLQLLVRGVLGFIWVYQGLIPKLLFPDTGEVAMLRGAGFAPDVIRYLLMAVGWGEIGFGLLFWLLPVRFLRTLYWLNCVGLVILGLGAMFSQPAVFIAPFNPFTLNLGMLGLAAVGLLLDSDEIPSATRCLRRPR
ncbi:DoxX-like family protein [Hymenobacter sp. J193]|uniref:DoxX-like family protein n=1 Tax=Hymenobacter sp. J193 TaxID=2898429 RepID=UPI0021507E37|nr:DoxX-like family protein [Hymenobacter sp. J193]MCR5889614.1 DoxX-like family protein [Hymenobacter sp. J193]